MFVHSPDPLGPVGGRETPRDVVWNRRRWLKAAGLAVGAAGLAGGYGAWRYLHPDEELVFQAGRVQRTGASSGDFDPAVSDIGRDGEYWPLRRDERFSYGRTETPRADAASHTNFYEFSRYKSSWRFVGPFEPLPWTLVVDGLCRQPLRLNMDEFARRFASHRIERQYRHRCVERWAMAIPWLGVPLAEIVKQADPMAEATHVRFVSFLRPDQAPHQARSAGEYPWPYAEGLTLAEATNELPLLATGMYGEPLLKQHGAPVRLVVPWKYGYKSIKSVERIEFVKAEPATFWSTLRPEAYPFESNVDPDLPVPWDQSTEWMLGTHDKHRTQLFNGYAQWVAHLYPNTRSRPS